MLSSTRQQIMRQLRLLDSAQAQHPGRGCASPHIARGLTAVLTVLEQRVGCFAAGCTAQHLRDEALRTNVLL